MPITFLLVIEGLRPDALVESKATNCLSLIRQGSYTMQAKTVFPSLTLPSHMSLFHSIPPIEHLVTDDFSIPSSSLRASLFDVLGRQGKKCGSFYSVESLRYLSRPGSLAFSYYRNKDHFDGDADIDLVSKSLSWICNEQPDFVFLHLSQADEAGHQFGWMSPNYLQRIENIDRAIGLILEKLPSGSTLALLGSHGGHGFEHGTKLPEDITVPWIIVGPGIRSSYQISRQVTVMDTAPTLARLMGIEKHREWQGQTVTEIFEPEIHPTQISNSSSNLTLAAY
ncbi:MAG: alkaline phosphatase family protein [Verrucomicrobia bacterium]|nr:alkaline phosphatase family protein [Verrucomicrobiota bacterium]